MGGLDPGVTGPAHAEPPRFQRPASARRKAEAPTQLRLV
jgi:hypothetical protein